jgi:hypothetical protein
LDPLMLQENAGPAKTIELEKETGHESYLKGDLELLLFRQFRDC